MKNSTEYCLNTDGGARGNPGPAAIGVVLSNTSGIVFELGVTIGETTNNVAEYKAIIKGLELCIEKVPPGSTLICLLDSELVVKQIKGEYRVKQPHLLVFKQKIDSLKSNLKSRQVNVLIKHIPRSENKDADKLVNQALDAHAC